MIILRQREFGNKATKAAKRLWEIKQIPEQVRHKETVQRLNELDKLREFRKSNKPNLPYNFYDERGQRILSRRHAKRAGVSDRGLWFMDHGTFRK